MQCFGVPEYQCIKSVCCMWVDDIRCPNFEWLASDKAKKRAKLKYNKSLEPTDIIESQIDTE